MATTGITDLDNMVQAELVDATTYETARALAIGAQLVAYDTFRNSNIKSYTRFTKVTAGALTAGTDGTATAMDDTQVSITLGEIGIGANVLDVLDVASTVADVARQIAQELGKAFADKVEIDILAKSTSLTDSVGSTGVALTEDVFAQGIMECNANDIGGRTLACVLFPKQAHQIRIALGGVTENTSNIWARPDMLSAFAGPLTPQAFSFRWWNVDVFESTNVPAVNTSADSSGMFLVPGQDAPIKLAIGQLTSGQPWFARVETQRDASLRSTEIWVTGFYGVGVPAPERGCRVLSVR
jgi:hypothetical protein